MTEFEIIDSKNSSTAYIITSDVRGGRTMAKTIPEYRNVTRSLATR